MPKWDYVITCFIILSEFIVELYCNRALVPLIWVRYLIQEARNLINSLPGILAPFLEASDMARFGTECMAWSISEVTKLKSCCSFLFSLGKGSSSISSDVSSSTDHTPTQAQKNVATSEGRHLVFIISLPVFTVLTIFGRQNVSLSSVLLSGSIWDS